MVRLTSPQSSMVYSFLLFVIILSAQQVYGELLASKEWLTIVGGFISSILFLLCLTVSPLVLPLLLPLLLLLSLLFLLLPLSLSLSLTDLDNGISHTGFVQWLTVLAGR